jgi:indole-3-glycerol phosphate synthase
MSATPAAAQNDILARIVADKSEAIIAAQLARPFAEVDAAARAATAPRGFEAALRAKIAAG